MTIFPVRDVSKDPGHRAAKWAYYRPLRDISREFTLL
jgi:hypothetical protein